MSISIVKTDSVEKEIVEIAQDEKDRILKLAFEAIMNRKKGELKSNQYYTKLSTRYKGYSIKIYLDIKDNTIKIAITNLRTNSVMRDEHQYALIHLNNEEIDQIYTSWKNNNENFVLGHSFRVPDAMFFKDGKLWKAMCSHYGIDITDEEFLKVRSKIIDLNKQGQAGSDEKQRVVALIKLRGLLDRALYRRQMIENGEPEDRVRKFMGKPRFFTYER